MHQNIATSLSHSPMPDRCFADPAKHHETDPTSTPSENLKYRAVLISSSHDFQKRIQSDECLHSPVSVDCFDRAGEITDMTDHKHHAISAAEGALKRCEANVKRMARLNSMMESFAGESWSDTDHCKSLARNLRNSKYFPALQSRMLRFRLMKRQCRHSQLANIVEHPQHDTELNRNAMRCGADMSDEVGSLQLLQERAVDTLRAMLRSMSGDVSICGEEVQAALSRVRSSFASANKALSHAVSRLAADKESSTLASRYFQVRSFCGRLLLCGRVTLAVQEKEGPPQR